MKTHPLITLIRRSRKLLRIADCGLRNRRNNRPVRRPQYKVLISLFCFPWLLAAQTTTAPQGDALQTALPAPTPPTNEAAPVIQTAPVIQAAPIAEPAPAAAPQTPAGKGILLNFQGAQLTDVLNYLSEAAGFVIVQDTPVTGTVNVISRQPLTADEAVDLLNTVLVEKGYVALREGRILKIVSRTDAQKRDLPVITGADPAAIPRKDNVVTQILPVRYADVSKLIDNLRPLLSDDASISANDASNAIILTDTQTNVRRIAEIISALDTSISGVSTMRVFPLHYADAKALADTLTQLFQTPAGSSTSGQGAAQGGFGGFGGFGGRGGGGFGGGFGGQRGGGGGGAETEAKSPARDAASRVVAVADAQSNSVIVSAPDEFMDTISDIVSRLDVSISDISETRIFTLLHADATEMATVLNSLYGESPSSGAQGQGSGNNNIRQGPGIPMFFGGQNNQPAAAQPSQRAVLQARVVVVPDPRTNSVIVSCARDSMEDIALTIGRLDASDSKKQHVHIYTLENADPDNVASILRGMFTTNGSDQSTTQQTDVLSQRTATGATSDIVNTLNTGGNSGSGSRSGAESR
jgi:type II secretory pathway component GspD/PulD (secretin)